MQQATDQNQAVSEPTCSYQTLHALVAVFVTLASFSLLNIPVPGINEPHYLTKARAFVDPAWCSRDFFLKSSNAHYLFYLLTGPFTQHLSFSTVAVGGRLLSLLLVSTGWVMLCRQLALTVSSSVLSAAAFCAIAMAGNLSGEWIVGGYEGKVPAWGLAFIGTSIWVNAWLSRRHLSYAFSGGCIGLATAVHPVVGGWFAVAIVLTEVFFLPASRRSGLVTAGRFLLNGAAFCLAVILFALPGLLPAAELILNDSATAEQIDRANYIQVFWRLAHHLDPTTFSLWSWIHTAILSAVVAAGGVSLLRGRMQQPDIRSGWKSMHRLLLISAMIAGVGVAIGWHSRPILQTEGWQWRAAVLKFYPFRLFDGLLPTVAALTAAAFFQKLQGRIILRYRRPIVVVFAVAVLATAAATRPVYPLVWTSKMSTDWKAACRWMRAHTPSDALILGPREGFGLKWFGHRAEYVCFKDCPQDTQGILEWNRRLWAIHHWSQNAWKDELFDNDDLNVLHQKTGVDYILTARLGPFSQAPVYENSTWRIYAVHAKAAAAVQERPSQPPQ